MRNSNVIAFALAAAMALPMAAATSTPAASWGVITKWWDSNKDTRFMKGLRSGDCWKEAASMSIYDSGNEDC